MWNKTDNPETSTHSNAALRRAPSRKSKTTGLVARLVTSYANTPRKGHTVHLSIKPAEFAVVCEIPLCTVPSSKPENFLILMLENLWMRKFRAFNEDHRVAKLLTN